MGFFRGVGVFFISILLLLSLIVTNVLITASLSMKYDTLKSQISPVLSNITSGNTEGILPSQLSDINTSSVNITQGIQEGLDVLKKNCQPGQASYAFDFNGQSYSVSCDLANETPETAVGKAGEQVFDQIYYKKYDCSFIQCIKTDPQSIVSEQTYNYLKTRLYYAIFISLVLAMILFLLFGRNSNFTITFGALLILSALPMLRVESFFVSKFGNLVSFLFKIFLSQSRKVFWGFVISGLVILCGGIGLRLWNTKIVKGVIKRSDEREKGRKRQHS